MCVFTTVLEWNSSSRTKRAPGKAARTGGRKYEAKGWYVSSSTGWLSGGFNSSFFSICARKFGEWSIPVLFLRGWPPTNTRKKVWGCGSFTAGAPYPRCALYDHHQCRHEISVCVCAWNIRYSAMLWHVMTIVIGKMMKTIKNDKDDENYPMGN